MLVIFLNLVLWFNYGSTQVTLDNYIAFVEQQASTLIAPYDVTASDVTFHFVSRTQSSPVLITSENAGLIDVTKKTKFIIHGWIQNYTVQWIQDAASEYLKTYDLNIIEVDYSKPASMFYTSSVAVVNIVGYAVAQFIRDRNLSPANTHLIGNSMGAQVSAFAGQNITAVTGEKLARITALDPAGPGYREPTVTDAQRLSKGDATIVDAHHTDALFFGYENPAGTLDNYVNTGSRVQPGCAEDTITQSDAPLLTKVFCSHERATWYFVESINNGTFHCKFCHALIGNYVYGSPCIPDGTEAHLGAEDITASTTGVCFSTANAHSPYLS